ncbi:hypothetical protein ACFC8N_15930 [Streptomyces sp. NPDC055966]|uniref:hypothetical protein n=1 Tax=Streptomyces sp. NPDC055966 TaxID=3345669 RepID=UPI0035DA6D88
MKIAEQGGRTPAQVAPARLLGRQGNVVPNVAATRTARLADSPASAEVRLDEVRALPLGLPHEPTVTRNTATADGPRRPPTRPP